MARSYRHTPIMGNCSHSDKPGKVKAHRSLRANVRMAFANCRDYDDLIVPILREVSNVWDFPKDGKHFFDAVKYAKYMRK